MWPRSVTHDDRRRERCAGQLPAVSALTLTQRRSPPELADELRTDRTGFVERHRSLRERLLGAQQDAILWKAVEEEVRNLLGGIAGANALRRHKLAQIGARAIGSQLALEPVM